MVPEYMKAYRSRSDEKTLVRAVLKNGITVIVEEYPAQPVACIGTYVNAGYFDETDDIVGISHVLEHMFFKGTTKRGLGKIARDTRALGGILNASTIYDRTWYYSVVPSEGLKKAMEIQADALQHSLLDAAELRKELQVIIQEARRKLDSPGAFSTEKLLQLAFEKHPMRRWRIGTEEGLRSITREKLDNFYRSLYSPDRITLVIVGDVMRDDVLEKVAELYAPFQRPSVASIALPEEPGQNSLRYGNARGDVQQSYVVFGFHTVAPDHPDYLPLLVLSQVLGAGRGSIFYQQLVERQRLLDSYDVYQMSFRGVGMFVISAAFEPEKVDRVEPGVLAEVEMVRKRELEPVELERAFTLLERQYYRALEDCQSRAEHLGHYQAILGDYRERDKFVAKARLVTPGQIQAAAEKYLKLENLSIFEYEPRSAPPRTFDAAALKSALDQKIPLAVQKRKSEGDAGLSAGESGKSYASFVSDFKRYPLLHTSVLRGPEVYYKENHTVPLVDIAFLYPGGRLDESEKNSGITELALNIAARESDHYRDGSLSLALERLGGTLHTVNAPDYCGFTLSILSRNLAQGVRLLGEVIQKPLFRDETVDREKQLQLAQLKRIRENNLAYPLQLCREALFKPHPYGYSALGTEAGVNALTSAQVDKWFKENITQIKPVVVMVGDIRGTSVVEEFARDFSGSRFKEKSAPKRALAPLEGVRERTEQREVKQTATALGFNGPAFSDRDSEVLDVIRNMVSGMGGRFFEELRDRQGLAYTVTVLSEKNRLGGAIYAYIATSPENAQRAQSGLLNQFARFMQEPIRDEEYYRALNATIGSHLIALQSRRAYLNEVARYVLFGIEVEELNDYPARIKSITIEDIKSAARKYFTTNTYATGTVRAVTAPSPAAAAH
jgi:zinc protease